MNAKMVIFLTLFFSFQASKAIDGPRMSRANIAKLGIVAIANSANKIICTGTLVTRRMILTADECIRSSKKIHAGFFSDLNMNTLDLVPDQFIELTQPIQNIEKNEREESAVKESFVSPDEKLKSLLVAHAIGLVLLKEDAPSNYSLTKIEGINTDIFLKDLSPINRVENTLLDLSRYEPSQFLQVGFGSSYESSNGIPRYNHFNWPEGLARSVRDYSGVSKTNESEAIRGAISASWNLAVSSFNQRKKMNILFWFGTTSVKSDIGEPIFKRHGDQWIQFGITTDRRDISLDETSEIYNPQIFTSVSRFTNWFKKIVKAYDDPKLLLQSGICKLDSFLLASVLQTLGQSSCYNIDKDSLPFIDSLLIRGVDFSKDQINDFSSFSGLSYLTFEKPTGKSLKTQFLNGVSKRLISFEISGSSLEIIAPDIFRSFANLTDVRIVNSPIQDISGLFSDLRELSYLDLQGLQLKSLKPEYFRGLNKLTFLNLSDNPIVNVSSDSFTDLNDETQIILSKEFLSAESLIVIDKLKKTKSNLFVH